MPIEKNENCLELSVKQLVIQLSAISLGQMICGAGKNKH